MTTYTKPLAMTGTGILALALLTGCATTEQDGGTAGDNAATQTAPATTAPAETSPTADQGTATATDTSTATGTETASPTTDAATDAAATGDDPVFAAIDALYAQHQDAFIVEIDREDDDSVYNIEAVIGDQVRDFDVMSDGTVNEDVDDADDDEDDIRKANEATVPAEDAATAALEGRAGQTIDDMELDEEDGTLHWQVELDLEDGSDGDELYVDAMTGAISQDN